MEDLMRWLDASFLFHPSLAFCSLTGDLVDWTCRLTLQEMTLAFTQSIFWFARSETLSLCLCLCHHRILSGSYFLTITLFLSHIQWIKQNKDLFIDFFITVRLETPDLRMDLELISWTDVNAEAFSSLFVDNGCHLFFSHGLFTFMQL